VTHLSPGQAQQRTNLALLGFVPFSEQKKKTLSIPPWGTILRERPVASSGVKKKQAYNTTEWRLHFWGLEGEGSEVPKCSSYWQLMAIPRL
jgi:hypothetical protein